MALILESIPNETPPKRAAASVPHAVIFVPGLNQEFNPYPLEEFSLHLADALDGADNFAQAKFRVGDTGNSVLGKSGETQCATIYREQDGQEAAVVKVYGLNYTNEFLGPYRELPPLVKFLLLPITILALPWRRILFPGGRSLTQREKLQFGLLTIVLLLMFVYALILILSVVSTFWTLQPDPGASGSVGMTVLPTLPATGEVTKIDPLAHQIPAWITTGRARLETTAFTRLIPVWDVISAIALFFLAIYRRVQAISPTLAVWATAAGLLIPTRAQILQAFDNGATVLVAMIQYHLLGSRRPRLRGQMNALLQDILEAPETATARIHILAYSFGSIVALDTIFRSDLKAPASFARISSLITVGSPFDLIHWLWPNYFRHRQRGVGLRWINIFAPQDVLSSNFLKVPKVKTVRAEHTTLDDRETHSVAGFAPDINLIYRPTDADDELSWMDVFRFVGLSSHNLYWERGKKRHSNAFDLAITEMFPNPNANLEAV